MAPQSHQLFICPFKGGALWAHHGWRLALPKGRPEAQDRGPSITPIVYLSL